MTQVYLVNTSGVKHLATVLGAVKIIPSESGNTTIQKQIAANK